MELLDLPGLHRFRYICCGFTAPSTDLVPLIAVCHFVQVWWLGFLKPCLPRVLKQVSYQSSLSTSQLEIVILSNMMTCAHVHVKNETHLCTPACFTLLYTCTLGRPIQECIGIQWTLLLWTWRYQSYLPYYGGFLSMEFLISAKLLQYMCDHLNANRRSTKSKYQR